MTTLLTPMIGSGADLKTWVLLLAGNIFIIVLVVRAVGYYGRKEWGELVGHLVAAVVVAGLVYMTDQSIGLLKEVWGMVFGK